MRKNKIHYSLHNHQNPLTTISKTLKFFLKNHFNIKNNETNGIFTKENT